METVAAPFFAFPKMMTELAHASWETIGYRIMLMAQGACTMSEYQLMASEKVEALQRIGYCIETS
jgi:hypothetical protein